MIGSICGWLVLGIFFGVLYFLNCVSDEVNWTPWEPLMPLIEHYLYFFCATISFIIAGSKIPWTQELITISSIFFIVVIIYCIAVPLFVIWVIVNVTTRNHSMIYRLIDYYCDIDSENAAQIDYNIFKKMYTLHPEKFEFNYYSWNYDGTDFTLNFWDFVRALNFKNKNKENQKRKVQRDKNSELIKKMQNDLAEDAERIRVEKAKAAEEMLSALKEQEEITLRVLKGEKK